MIKGSTQGDDITVVNIYMYPAPIQASQYMKQM